MLGPGELVWARWNVSGSSVLVATVGQPGQPTRVELQVPPSMASLVLAQVFVPILIAVNKKGN